MSSLDEKQEVSNLSMVASKGILMREPKHCEALEKGFDSPFALSLG